MRSGYEVLGRSPIKCCDRLSSACPRRRRTFLLVGTLILLLVATVLFHFHLRYPYNIEENSYILNFKLGERKLGRNKTLVVYDLTKSLDRVNFPCIKTITRPPITVCLFDIWHDVFISRSLQSARIWEIHIVSEFLEAVRRGGPDAGVLDIGANIGYYTLLAAKLGRRVVAVEPLIDSIQRLQRAAQIDDVTDHVTLVHNAVAEVRTTATLRPSGDNQGDARIELQVKECHGSCPPTIDTILLDDLVPLLPFNQAVMKIDIQGYEHHVFQQAHKLFQSVHFTNIFMEWLEMREHYVSANHTSRDKDLVNEMIQFLLAHEFRPHQLAYYGGLALDPAEWNQWPFDIVWHRLPDDQEASRIARNHYRNWPQF